MSSKVQLQWQKKEPRRVRGERNGCWRRIPPHSNICLSIVFGFFFFFRKAARNEENPSAHPYRGVKGMFKVLNRPTFNTFLCVTLAIKKITFVPKSLSAAAQQVVVCARIGNVSDERKIFVLIDARSTEQKVGFLCSWGFVIKWNWSWSLWIIALE